jgi:pentatricopeptide repeat protein
MVEGNIHLLSTYLKKWSYQENRITLSYSYFSETGYTRNKLDMRINSPQVMVNEFLNNLVNKAKEMYVIYSEDNQAPTIKIVNESEVQRKLHLFLSKILKEFNNNKRSRGRMRMISSRSMDFYYNDYEYEPLDNKSKFYVHLNRGINKMNGDLWAAAIEELQLALSFDEDNPLANKFMAQAFIKSHRIEEALPYFKKYADKENSTDSLNELAHAYIKLGLYKEAEEIFNKMKEISPQDILAQIGEAQIAYLRGESYLAKLDEIKNINELFLLDYLKKSWEYKIPGLNSDGSKMWNAATASRYLGYDRPFDLTKRAFNDEIPCYFDPERGTIRFIKEELDRWVEIMNRFGINGVRYELHEDRLTKEELESSIKKVTKKKSKKSSGTQESIPSGKENELV